MSTATAQSINTFEMFCRYPARSPERPQAETRQHYNFCLPKTVSLNHGHFIFSLTHKEKVLFNYIKCRQHCVRTYTRTYITTYVCIFKSMLSLTAQTYLVLKDMKESLVLLKGENDVMVKLFITREGFSFPPLTCSECLCVGR